jgi:hypothetical protein
MPSVKSYQNRKHEIERLCQRLVEKDIEFRKKKVELQQEIEALKLTIRLYREYIIKAYNNPDAASIIEIPGCFKPYDSIAFIAKEQEKQESEFS